MMSKIDKIFIEYGFDPDNNKYGFGRSVEIEKPDGTEYRTKQKIVIIGKKEIYLRFWIGKKCVSWDKKSGLKIKRKNKNNLKIIFGIYGMR